MTAPTPTCGCTVDGITCLEHAERLASAGRSQTPTYLPWPEPTHSVQAHYDQPRRCCLRDDEAEQMRADWRRAMSDDASRQSDQK